MAASVIKQNPIFNVLPVGQEVIFVVSNDTAVNNEQKVKFVAKVHISSATPNPSTTTDLIGTFKTTPNNAGVGIFDFRNVIENYVKADNLSYYTDDFASTYKGATTNAVRRFLVHTVDKYSLNFNCVRYLGIEFSVEYLGAEDAAGNQNDNVVRIQDGTEKNSDIYKLFNGYLNPDDVLEINGASGNFGYNLDAFNLTDSTKSFLTNAPITQYANDGDYGTLPILAEDESALPSYIKIIYYDSDGSTISTADTIDNDNTNAGTSVINSSDDNLLFIGCFPGNLQNWSTNYVAAKSAGLAYYTVTAHNSANAAISQTYTINVNCPDDKNFESIRLCWLNKWGAWDYYTFTKKSVRKLTTKGTTYTQLHGTWNAATYSIDSFKGGKKTFRVNATESITINTDCIPEGENIMFEEMINSPEIYMLEGYKEDLPGAMLNEYITPVRLKTSSFTRKTIANDRIIQYTFEIEKTKTLRTQAV
tara:strand:- start:8945 stop:10372 length:1428 start_codon:yes stop_codon:yes gene_type:complete